MPKRALILIDLQNDYFPGGKWTLRGIESAANNAARVLAAVRAAGDLVVHVRHEFPTLAAASRAIRPGRSLRAVKLLPMKSTFTGALPRTRVAMSSSSFAPPKGRAAFS